MTVRRLRLFLLAVGGLLLGWPAAGRAQAGAPPSLRVAVIGSQGEPIPGAAVLVLPVGIEALTGADGIARIDAAVSDTIAVRIRRTGFATTFARVAVEAGATLDLFFELVPVDPAIDRTVLAALEDPLGVDIRRASGRFRRAGFLDSAAVAAGRSIDDLLRRLPNVTPSGAAQPRMQALNGRACPATVLLDGAPVVGGPPAGLRPADLRAVESYAARERAIPDLFAPFVAECGVVALWLRAAPTPAVAAASETRPPAIAGPPVPGPGAAPPASGSPVTILIGTVQDPARQPIAEARVTALGIPDTATTDAAGRFRLAGVPVGPQLVRVRKLGLRPGTFPVTLQPGDSVQQVFVLDEVAYANAQRLDTVRVSARGDRYRPEDPPNLVSFLARKRSNIYSRSAFIERKDAEQVPAVTLSDWLRRTPGVRVVQLDRFGTRFRQQVRIRGGAGVEPYCVPFIWLDGIPFNKEGQVDEILPDQVAAIEVHRGLANTPPEFQQGTNLCGVILIWTRTS